MWTIHFKQNFAGEPQTGACFFQVEISSDFRTLNPLGHLDAVNPGDETNQTPPKVSSFLGVIPICKPFTLGHSEGVPQPQLGLGEIY